LSTLEKIAFSPTSKLTVAQTSQSTLKGSCDF
jgi:hypothetical protein